MDISGNTIDDNSILSDEHTIILDTNTIDNVDIVGTTDSITISTGNNDTFPPLAQLDELMNNGFVANEVSPE